MMDEVPERVRVEADLHGARLRIQLPEYLSCQGTIRCGLHAVTVFFMYNALTRWQAPMTWVVAAVMLGVLITEGTARALTNGWEVEVRIQGSQVTTGYRFWGWPLPGWETVDMSKGVVVYGCDRLSLLPLDGLLVVVDMAWSVGPWLVELLEQVLHPASADPESPPEALLRLVSGARTPIDPR